MSPKLFTGLGICAAVLLVVAAIVNATSDQWSSGVPTGTKLFPQLASNLESARTLTIKRGDKTLVLERKSDTEWVAKSSSGYPTQADKIRALTAKLADAELVAPKTRMPERFSLLDLADVGKDAKSRLITVAGNDGKTIAEVIIGKRSVEQFGAGKGGTYVRKPGHSETWLINTEIDVNPDVNQWVDTTVFEAKIADVKRVTVERPGEPGIVIEREAGKPANKDGYKLVDMPAGKALKTDYVLEDVINSFARVELEDVRKPAAAPQPAAAGAQPADAKASTQKAAFESEKGLKITLDVTGKGDQHWARIKASGTGDAKAEADKINAKVADWEFRLPSWKYQQMFKKRDDLLKDAAPPAAAKTTPPPETTPAPAAAN